MSGTRYKGRCMCGAVTFSVVPVNNEIGVCHCGMCRRWSSGPFMEIDCGSSFEADSDEHLRVFESSEWAERGFCSKCGSSLFYRLKGDGGYQVSVGAIEGLSEAELALEVFIDEKPAYYSFAQKTKQMTGAELIAMFTAEDD